MIKNQINSLSLKQLIFLEFLLRKMALTPLCDALLTAIPILMSNGLTSHVTELSFTELSQVKLGNVYIPLSFFFFTLTYSAHSNFACSNFTTFQFCNGDQSPSLQAQVQ